MEVLYTAEAHATGGREGRVGSADGVLDLERLFLGEESVDAHAGAEQRA